MASIQASSSPSKFLDIFVVFIILAALAFYIKKYHTEVAYVTSTIDDRTYLVRRLPDKQEAANYLAKINQKLIILVKHLMAKYPDDPRVRKLYQNFNPNNVSEGSPTSGYTSYSVNKGERIIMCIRQKDNFKFVDQNVVLYVAIHELGHLATITVGHDSSFWENFRFLLKEAIDIGIYERQDYQQNPVQYCGIKITSSVV